jgi:hypothetical protein
MSLVLGFGLSELTGVRAVGGAVLVAGLAVCAWLWWGRVGVARTVGLSLLFLALFAGSHLLARAIGAWPSVFLVAAVMAVAAWLVADLRPAHAA